MTYGRVDEQGRVIKDQNGDPVTKTTQMIIGWHVDDFLISHRSQKSIEEIVRRLDSLYGTMDPLKVHTGDVREYLRMTLDFQTTGKVKIKMEKYVEEMLEGAPEGFEGAAETPAAQHLFDINPSAEPLDSVFHHLVANSLFLCKRARPDLQLTVGFLCGRVKRPDVDYWKS